MTIDLAAVTSLEELLRNRAPALFERFPVDSTVRLFDAIPEDAVYKSLTDEILELWQEILDAAGAEGLERYNHVTMLTLMRDFERRAAPRDYTPRVVAHFHRDFARILDEIENAEPGIHAHTGDILFKDLAVCRQKMIPVDSGQVIELVAYQRSALYLGGPCQFFRFLFFFLFVARGRRHFYTTHTHDRRLAEFTAENREDYYLTIAGMLERHPEIKGWFAQSWFLDPSLSKISPRLDFVRKHASENGGWSFYMGHDDTGMALQKSPTRRRLHAEGRYQPKNYLVIWPRRKLLAWARRRA